MMKSERTYCVKVRNPITEEERQKLTKQEIRKLDYHRRNYEFIYEEFLAYDLFDATDKVIKKYGNNKSYSLWNEEDANKPR